MNAELLSDQLRESLRALATGVGEPFEAAVLAGLLARTAPTSSLLDDARTALAGHDAAQALTGDCLNAALDRLIAVEEEDEPEEVYDQAIADLDELCAGAAFLGEAGRVAETIDLAARLISAFPRPFCALAYLASAVLQEEPPVPGDPARRLWSAIEAAPWQRDPEGPAPACDAARRRLGLL